MSRVCMLADTLSWAARHSIPLQQALPSVPFYRRPNSQFYGALVVLAWILTPVLMLFAIPWLVDVQWSVRLERLIEDLDRGEKLSVALRKHFPRRLPEFFFLGIERAETTDRLETALPILADQLNYPCRVAQERTVELLLVMHRYLVLAMVTAFLAARIAPQLEELCRELTGTESSPGFVLPIAVVHSLAGIAGWTIFLLMIMHWLGGLYHPVLLDPPMLGRDLKRFVLGDLALSMATFIRLGDDIVMAAEWSRLATRSPWMKKRLEAFVQSVRSGTRWDKAWLKMEVGKPLDQWVIANAAHREDPASGFELMAAWIQQETELSMKRLARWADPIGVLVMAILVGSVCYSFFHAIVSFIDGML